MSFEAVIKVVELGAPYLAFFGGVGFGWLKYNKKLRTEATSVAISYMYTIKSINESLIEVKDNILGDAIEILLKLPPDKVRDYRNEDWFDVHRALSDRLGYLYHLDEDKGAEANENVIQFFSKLKFARDIWSYVIMLAAAQPASSTVESSDPGTTRAREVINKKMKSLRDKLSELTKLGDETVTVLGELSPRHKKKKPDGSHS